MSVNISGRIILQLTNFVQKYVKQAAYHIILQFPIFYMRKKTAKLQSARQSVVYFPLVK